MRLKTFQYSLAGAQRLEDYRLDGMTVELSELKAKLEAKLREHRELKEQIVEGERATVKLIQQQPLFWLERREALAMQILDRRERLFALEGEMEALRGEMTALIGRITEARSSQRVFEKHRENCKAEFDKQQEKALEAWLDEMWLARTQEGA
jgi:chromosome segregation ATPase